MTGVDMRPEIKALDFASDNNDQIEYGAPVRGTLYLSDRQVGQRYGVSRLTIWRWHRENDQFPRALKLSQRTTRWRLADLIAWETAGSPSS
jgi:prophage regulatory protein